jgi:hypothetical protein
MDLDAIMQRLLSLGETSAGYYANFRRAGQAENREMTNDETRMTNQ